MNPHLTLELDAEEVLYLEGEIENDEEAAGLPNKETVIQLGRPTVLLLGGAFVELVTPEALRPGVVLLSVDEETAWLLRSRVSADAVGSDRRTNIGVNLLRKIYALLLEFNVGVDLEDTLVDEVNIPLDEIRARMEEFKNG